VKTFIDQLNHKLVKYNATVAYLGYIVPALETNRGSWHWAPDRVPRDLLQELNPGMLIPERESAQATEERKFQKDFGEKVRAYRKKEGISQDELAGRCRLDRTYIGSVERGERNVSLVNIYKLAAGLMVQPAWLFEEITVTVTTV
jgi:DNA-binding XRE family transcriptional regulator